LSVDGELLEANEDQISWLASAGDPAWSLIFLKFFAAECSDSTLLDFGHLLVNGVFAAWVFRICVQQTDTFFPTLWQQILMSLLFY